MSYIRHNHHRSQSLPTQNKVSAMLNYNEQSKYSQTQWETFINYKEQQNLNKNEQIISLNINSMSAQSLVAINQQVIHIQVNNISGASTNTNYHRTSMRNIFEGLQTSVNQLAEATLNTTNQMKNHRVETKEIINKLVETMERQSKEADKSLELLQLAVANLQQAVIKISIAFQGQLKQPSVAERVGQAGQAVNPRNQQPILSSPQNMQIEQQESLYLPSMLQPIQHIRLKQELSQIYQTSVSVLCKFLSSLPYGSRADVKYFIKHEATRQSYQTIAQYVQAYCRLSILGIATNIQKFYKCLQYYKQEKQSYPGIQRKHFQSILECFIEKFYTRDICRKILSMHPEFLNFYNRDTFSKQQFSKIWLVGVLMPLLNLDEREKELFCIGLVLYLLRWAHRRYKVLKNCFLIRV